jgi:hypothetical protein
MMTCERSCMYEKIRPTVSLPYSYNCNTTSNCTPTELKSGAYCSIYCSIRIGQNLCLLFGQLGLCRQGKIVTVALRFRKLFQTKEERTKEYEVSRWHLLDLGHA